MKIKGEAKIFYTVGASAALCAVGTVMPFPRVWGIVRNGPRERAEKRQRSLGLKLSLHGGQFVCPGAQAGEERGPENSMSPFPLPG